MVTSPTIRIISHNYFEIKRNQRKSKTVQSSLLLQDVLWNEDVSARAGDADAGLSMPGFSIDHANVWRYNFLK